MLAISRKSEYGIIALKYMMKVREANALCTTKEIASRFKISEQLMAKVLQKLTRAGLITSTQGAHGGYKLALSPQTISVAQIVESIDGPPAIVDCAVSGTECTCVQYREDVCNINNAFMKIQVGFRNFLEGITLSDFDDSLENSPQFVNVSL